VLFAATSVIWGSSFLFIRVAVEHLPPSAVVFGRTALGTAFLVPLAIRNHAFRGLCRAVVPVLVVTALDMALPTSSPPGVRSGSVPRWRASSPPPTRCSPPCWRCG